MKLGTRLPAALLMAALCGWPAVRAGAADPAKDYPNRPIRMIMPNAPGSSIDTIGRIFAARFSETVGQQVVVDNRSGAGGLLGMEIGANATPDGYTVIASSTAAMSIAPHIHRKLPYDPIRSFEFVSLYAITPNVLVVNPSQPVKSVKEFVEYAKSRGKQLNMASAGSGAQSHLTGVALMVAAGFESLHVPYKGGGASVASVIAGESHWTITPAPAVMSHVKAGRLRALGHSLPQRSALLGDLPSIKETVPTFEYSGWIGLLAPKGTSKAILNKLREALVKTVNIPQLREQFAAQGAQVITDTPEEFRRHVQQEIVNTGKIVKAAGLKID